MSNCVVTSKHRLARAGNDVKAYLRTQVVSPPLPVRLSGELSADLSVVVVRDVVNHECAFLAHRINGQSTRRATLEFNLYERMNSAVRRRVLTLVKENEHRMGYECRGCSLSSDSAGSSPSSNSASCSVWMSAMEKINRMLQDT